jgi:Subtilase family
VTNRKGQGSKKKGSQSSTVVPRTIVVRFKEYVKLPYVDSLENRFTELGLSSLVEIFQEFPNMTMNRLYTSISSDKIEKLMKEAHDRDKNFRPLNLLLYYRIILPDKVRAYKIIEKLKEVPLIDEVYLESGPVPPPMVNASDDPRSAKQGYLNAAPAGIDALYSWTYSGGDGMGGVQFVDMERGWTLNHEDLVAKGVTLISGVNKDFFGHGTSVLGEVVAVDNIIGNVGIAPNISSARVVSIWRTNTNYNTSDAIMSAINVLNFGDVLLLEAQAYKPGTTDVYYPIEVEAATFATISLATAYGIIVVEPAANGSVRGVGENLDNFTDSNGQQILNRRSGFDSGAIMVGAGRRRRPHSRSSFSNFGTRVDCYAWGNGIDTTGDGGIGNLTNTYTSSFSGTSGASAIIAGAALCIQGVSQSTVGYTLSPMQMRSILSSPAY